ncbi:MAG: class I SAM-dependent methyltransferase [Pleurocapsa sp. MO_226.B13]|nr:class I SAM-dependent methyltransferase [Pleurocapsa sp. MO_226.B13]
MKFLENLSKAFSEKNALQRHLSRKTFESLQALGFHVLGDHFYEPVPNTAMIQQFYSDEPRECSGIDFNFAVAEQTLVTMIDIWGKEFYQSATKYGYREVNNYFFRGLDAVTLYCFIRKTKPKRIVEIGQGFSTIITMAALEANHIESRFSVEKFISIDPYDRLSFREKKIAGIRPEVLLANLQDVPLEIFSSLCESDLLFVDSSHVYKFGSDVEYLFEKVYPNLAPGVNIHVHDISSPYHYPLSWYTEHKRFWNEQHYLENFLRFNPVFRVEIPVYYLSRNSKILAEKCYSICEYKGFKLSGNSFYLKRISLH